MGKSVREVRIPTVGIIGCSIIGQKRAKALGAAQLLACADVQEDRANTLTRLTGNPEKVLVTSDWKTIMQRGDVDIVVVATTNDMLAEITLAAVEARKH